MRGLIRGALAIASVAMCTPAIAIAQAKPVVAVLYFNNNSFGKDRADFEGIGKGIADMLITDMAQNSNVRVVEREQIQALLTEQNLTKAGTIDPKTAIRLGKIIGAQYMITGAFMSNGRGTYVIDVRAINVETSEITNPTRLTSKGDDVLALIAQLSEKLNTDMKLPALQVGQAGPSGAAMPAGQPAGAQAPVQVADATPPAPTPAAPAPAAAAPNHAAPAPASRPVEARPATKVASKRVKMDIRTAMLYSKALEQKDAGNRTAAVELFKQVVDKFPEYAPAQRQLAALTSRGS